MLGVFPLWVWLSVLIAVVVTRPLEARLWRQGRLSNRGLAILLLARSPFIAIFAVLAYRFDIALGLFLIAISALPGIVLYRFVRDQIEEQAREQARARDRTQSSHV